MNIAEQIIELRNDFMLAHSDISWLTVDSHMHAIGVTWSAHCRVGFNVKASIETGDIEQVTGDMESVYGVVDLGMVLEEVYRRANFSWYSKNRGTG